MANANAKTENCSVGCRRCTQVGDGGSGSRSGSGDFALIFGTNSEFFSFWTSSSSQTGLRFWTTDVVGRCGEFEGGEHGGDGSGIDGVKADIKALPCTAADAG